MQSVLVKETPPSTKQSVGEHSSHIKKANFSGDNQAWGGTHLEHLLSSKSARSVDPDIQLSETENNAKSPPNNEKGLGNKAKKSQEVVDKDLGVSSSRPGIDRDAGNPDHLHASEKVSPKGGNGTFQQMGDLVARKSMAPPLVSHGASPKSRLSRASSTDTNTDSVRSAQRQIHDHSRESHQSSAFLHVRPLQTGSEDDERLFPI